MLHYKRNLYYIDSNKFTANQNPPWTTSNTENKTHNKTIKALWLQKQITQQTLYTAQAKKNQTVRTETKHNNTQQKPTKTMFCIDLTNHKCKKTHNAN